MTQFLSIFSNIGQVLEFGQVLIVQLKNVYSVNLTKDARFGVDTVENKTKEGGMEILQQSKTSLQLVMGFEKYAQFWEEFWRSTPAHRQNPHSSFLSQSSTYLEVSKV